MFHKDFEKYLISKYLGVPYLHQGRTEAGLDCFGLIICVKADQGFRVTDTEEDYDPAWAVQGKNMFIENYHREWDRVSTPQPGDVVLFSSSFRDGTDRARQTAVDHGGVVLHDKKFMHTCKAGTVVARLDDAKWAKRVYGFFRLKGEK